MKAIILASLLALNSQASAAWISGGGSLDYTANNPWFFNETTRTVEYCLLVDEAAFGMSANEIEPAVMEAIAFWKAEIREAADLVPNFPQQIGLETYTRRQDCDINDNTIDLKLQFGVLTDDQRSVIGSPEQFAGLTIRTSYDEARKKGSGFIYIGAQAGPMKMVHAIENPWSKYGVALLKHVLAHEFSHIFGMEHHDGIWLLQKNFVMDVLSTESGASAATRKVLDYQVLAFNQFVDFTCTQGRFLAPSLGHRRIAAATAL